MNNSEQNNVSKSTISIAGVEMHYCVMGNGPKLALAFHGYGQHADVFHFLHNREFTVLSFDLPFQGKTRAPDNFMLDKDDLVGLVQQLTNRFQVNKISLVGFSLGARVCLCLLEVLAQKISNVVLIAPDGIRHNWFYHFLTNTNFGRLCFQGFVLNGRYFIRVFSILNRLGLLNKTMYKFALQYIRTRESRQLLYNIWFSTRKLVPRLKMVEQQIRSKSIPIHLLVGQQDVVIPVKNAVKFKRKNPSVHIHVFERGHNLLEFEEVRGSLAAWLFRTQHSSKI